jgi:hypothetical protein
MQRIYEADESGKAFVEECVRRAHPDAGFEWHVEERRELFSVMVRLPGGRVGFYVTREALHQAADDRSSHARLASEIRQQLRIAQSGWGALVKEV